MRNPVGDDVRSFAGRNPRSRPPGLRHSFASIPLPTGRGDGRSSARPIPWFLLVLLALACALTQARAAVTHFVNLNNAASVSPYLTWASAATTIQAAVDAASAGDEIVVSNGVYQSGSRVVYGATANRVAVTKALRVRSVNGPAVTVIRGYQVPALTNGDTAIRCVYLTNGALLGGFTLSNGAVRKAGDMDKERSGGGVWCESTSAVLSNCVLSANAASASAGGAYQGTLKQCLLTGNWAGNGGGAYLSALTASALRANHADNGGGAYSCNLTNCTLTGNSATDGGGVCVCTVLNSIVRTNTAPSEANCTSDSLLSYCCTTPLPASGTGNLDADPMLTDGVHVDPASPCAGRGSFAATSGLDMDGEAWANPPAIGCDQPPANPTGPITLTLQLSATNTLVGMAVNCQATIVGQVSAWRWDFADGTIVSNLLSVSHAWTALGDYPVVLRAYNQTYPTGVTTTVMLHVITDLHYVVSNNPAPSPPYGSWATAAANIQDAVDACLAPGAVVLVSNGLYQTGGRIVYGALSNRIAVTKAVTVQSLNGPAVTQIRGYQVPGTTNGDGAVRCVYLTNGAVLAGFTLTGGAVRTAGDNAKERSGGGVWCESKSAVVSNCVLSANAGSAAAGGAYQGTLKQCVLTGNWASSGGGAYLSALSSSALSANHADAGGGAASCILTNCTLTANSATNGGGVLTCTLLNSIVRSNSATSAANYTSDSQLSYCCTTPLPGSGTGNLDTDPLLSDGVHLDPASPCNARGSYAAVSDLDIDSRAWDNPPAIGCAERSGAATGPISPSIQVSSTNTTSGAFVNLQATAVGQVMSWRWDFSDGTVVSNLPVVSHAWIGAGDYQVVLWAYNQTYPNGVSAALTMHVVPAAHYVVSNNPSASPPYNSWETAATNIQDALDVAGAGDQIVVSNGIYQTGGRVVYGAMTNRVAVTKPVTVRSLNGPAATIICGYQVPGVINGDGGIRCAYLTNGAVLSGFTLTNGATRASGDTTQERSGGGVWCVSTNALVTNCVITGNWAAASGGGAYAGTLQNCFVVGNGCQLGGGGACNGVRNNCVIAANWASSGPGGGVYNDTLINCTVTGNSATWAGGAYQGTLNNCIVYYNQADTAPNFSGNALTLNYCCTSPAPGSGTGNITAEPQLTSASRLSSASLCRGAGSAAYTTGVDLDGESWLSPPSIGCDEYHAGSVTGPLTVAIQASSNSVFTGTAVNFTAAINGRAMASVWDFGDGTILSNRPFASHGWGLARDYDVVLRAYNESYPAGVSAMVTIRVVAAPVHYVALTSTTPVPPYTSWSTAAQTIQDAVDAALPGAKVLVSNGVYATGGRVVYGAMTNRVAVTKAVTVQSVNGPAVTVIRGYQVPGTTNGDGAIRCVYLTNGVVLNGFTLRGGATRASGSLDREESGGGVWCASTSALVTNCWVIGNWAFGFGGGAYAGTLQNCTVTGNWCRNGGGAYNGIANNCLFNSNVADSAGGGGGAYSVTLNNCTLTGNWARGTIAPWGPGGGAAGSTLNNCIVYSNIAGNYYSDCTLNYCCTTPAPTNGIGNITNNPDLYDSYHLNVTSPCRGAGGPATATGTDLEGKAWFNPPSIGCDEFHPESVGGPMWA